MYSMKNQVAHLLNKERGACGVAALLAAAGLAVLMVGTPASAQDPKAAPPAARQPLTAAAASRRSGSQAGGWRARVWRRRRR
jgi:hypothetical protein